MPQPRVLTGLDALVQDGFQPLRGRRVALIANPTSVDARMNHLADLVHSRTDITLVALFGPEHGARGDAQDMVPVDSTTDPRTGAPVHTLYGPNVASLTPTAAQLEGTHVLVYDVQDVGSRYYTFAATMLFAMRAAAANAIAFVVLDRPNPIGGELIEGPIVQPGYESFVSAYPLPVRHGLTVGELANLFRDELKLDLDLTVVPCQGWARSMTWRETGIPWVAPSPNMPTPETALVYPGGCLLEGTNLSEGRGTTRPFELWGAPWLDPHRLVESCHDVLAAVMRPCAFRPTFHKHSGSLCLGAQPHVTHPHAFRSTALYAELIAHARAQSPERFQWRTETYEFVDHPIAIDLLFGSSREREIIEIGHQTDRRAWSALWADDETEFAARREPYLMYP